MHRYLEVLKKYAVFSGRAPKEEYWMFTLISVAISVALAITEGIIGIVPESEYSVFVMLYGLAILLPSTAVSVRRLHDTGRSGWWLLIALLPLIGGIALLIFMLQSSQPGDNQFGPNPKVAKHSRPATAVGPELRYTSRYTSSDQR